MEAFLRHWTICDNDNLWFVENILQNACLYKRWGSHSSDPEFVRIDTKKRQVSRVSLRGFLNKLRTFEKLLVGERGEIGHDVQGRYVIWQLTTLFNHCDLFALWHTAQRSPLFQSAVKRGSRVEYIADNIRFLYMCNKNQQNAHFLLWCCNLIIVSSTCAHPHEDLYVQLYGISLMHPYKQSGRWQDKN